MEIAYPPSTDAIAEHLKEMEDAFVRMCAEAEAEARKVSTKKQVRSDG
jgi:hypothetical protein